MTDNKAKRISAMLGITIAWTALIVMPMSLALQYGIISSVEAPQWVWILFWSQIPVGAVGCVIQAFLKQVLESDD